MASVNIRTTDNRQKVISQMKSNVARAAMAVGTDAVGLVVTNMRDGYGKPIRQTGDLMRDVHYDVSERNGKTVITIGNSLFYTPFVHEGTCKMAGRPYMRDAITRGWDRLQDLWRAYLKDGFLIMWIMAIHRLTPKQTCSHYTVVARLRQGRSEC